MATYTLAEAPEVTVSVRGKDSLITRNKAIDKITDMLESGELLTELPNGLSTEQLILTEASAKTTDAEGDEEQEPLEMAVRELQKFLFLKLRTQRIKQGATQARQNIATILTEESIEQDLDQLEEMLKGNFKTLKEFVGILREYRQAKPGAESALVILDEALQFNLSSPATSNASATSTEIEPLASDTNASTAQNNIANNDTETEVSVAEAGTTENNTDKITTETAKNSKQIKAQPNGSKVRPN